MGDYIEVCDSCGERSADHASSCTALAPLLADVAKFLRRFVVVSPDQLAALALWILHAYAIEAFDTTPYVIVTSAAKRSGKSRLLEVLDVILGDRAMFTANMSGPALFRVIDRRSDVVILFDEYDRIGKERGEELAGLINSGFRRGAHAIRIVGQGAGMVDKSFATFCPKVLAGIGYLPDTITDRGLSIRMVPRTRAERIEPFHYRIATSQAEGLRARLEAWVTPELIETLAAARPELPTVLNDRAQDAVEPLLAIADLVRVAWPKVARKAFCNLFADADTGEEAVGLLALRHIREAFEAADQPESLWTTEILSALVRRDDGPWSEWWGDQVEHGKPQAAAQRLGRLIHPFGVSRPHTVRHGEQTRKGYAATAFAEAWSRHLPDVAVTSDTADTVQVGPTSDVSPESAVTALTGARKPSESVRSFLDAVPLSQVQAA